MFHVHVPFISDNAFYDNEMSQENLFRIQSDAIRKAAEEGPCVFVGRCAEYVLREHKNLVSIFITADIDERIAQIRQRHDCTEEEARKIIENQEKGRSSYYNSIRARHGERAKAMTSASTRPDWEWTAQPNSLSAS